MEDYIQQVEMTLKAQLWVIAAIGALTLPDICGALPAPNGQATGQRYIKWFDEHVSPLGYGGFLNGQDCYRLRCSLLHQGSAQHPKSHVGRILLFAPRPDGGRLHNIGMDFGTEKCLILDVETFCNDLTGAARTWWAASKDDDLVKKNFDRFVRYWPNGISPFVDGTALIG
jgi:hypothetical protein